jgi:hypothetical protein
MKCIRCGAFMSEDRVREVVAVEDAVSEAGWGAENDSYAEALDLVNLEDVDPDNLWPNDQGDEVVVVCERCCIHGVAAVIEAERAQGRVFEV